jgi:hypothetical protein
MKKRILLVALGFLGILAVLLPAARWGWTQGEKHKLLFSKSKLIIEFNSSAEDIGVQVLLDGEPWRKLAIFTPSDLKVLDVLAQRSLRKQGLTEFFFESSEPSLAEVPLEEFLARFPEGEYEFEGLTVEGEAIEGVATFTHVIPAGPEIISPVSETEDLPVVDTEDFEIEWVPVTETIFGSEDIEIVGYQVIVEQVEPLRVFSIHLPASATSVEVPEEFFAQKGTLHKFEVLAIEAGGNQTITEGEFLTADD